MSAEEIKAVTEDKQTRV